ncbi:MAG: hypothetical protein GC159_06870 [Phycisphaera sp.]|nr:hypothetical protein [Phycisphaera sp.]
MSKRYRTGLIVIVCGCAATLAGTAPRADEPKASPKNFAYADLFDLPLDRLMAVTVGHVSTSVQVAARNATVRLATIDRRIADERAAFVTLSDSLETMLHDRRAADNPRLRLLTERTLAQVRQIHERTMTDLTLQRARLLAAPPTHAPSGVPATGQHTAPEPDTRPANVDADAGT